MTSTARRELHHARARQDILAASARVFARQGLTAPTIQDIAQEAGFAAGSLYTYFSGKEEILESLWQQVRGDFVALVDEPMSAGLTFQERITELLRRQLQYVDQHRDTFAAFAALHADGGSAAKGRGPRPAQHAQRLAAWLRVNATPEDLSGHDPQDVACLLAGMVRAFFLRWLEEGARSHFVDLTPRLAGFLLHGLGPEAPRPAARKPRR